MTNLLNGVDQYRFPSLERVQTFSYDITANLPMQVATAFSGAWIVCGGDNGFGRVFDRRTGQLITCLHHGSGMSLYEVCTAVDLKLINMFVAAGTYVQVVAVSSYPNVYGTSSVLISDPL